MQVKSIVECSKGEHSAILLTFIKLPFVIKTFVLSIVEWLFYTGFTVAPAINYKGKSGLNVCGSFLFGPCFAMQYCFAIISPRIRGLRFIYFRPKKILNYFSSHFFSKTDGAGRVFIQAKLCWNFLSKPVTIFFRSCACTVIQVRP